MNIGEEDQIEEPLSSEKVLNINTELLPNNKICSSLIIYDRLPVEINVPKYFRYMPRINWKDPTAKFSYDFNCKKNSLPTNLEYDNMKFLSMKMLVSTNRMNNVAIKLSSNPFSPTFHQAKIARRESRRFSPYGVYERSKPAPIPMPSMPTIDEVPSELQEITENFAFFCLSSSKKEL